MNSVLKYSRQRLTGRPFSVCSLLAHFSVQTLLKQWTSELHEVFWVGVSTGLHRELLCWAPVSLSEDRSLPLQCSGNSCWVLANQAEALPQNTVLHVAAFLVPINTLSHLSALNLLHLNNSILFRIPWVTQWLICLFFMCDPVELMFSSLHDGSDFPFTLKILCRINSKYSPCRTWLRMLSFWIFSTGNGVLSYNYR